MRISVIIPVLNERESLVPLHDELAAACRGWSTACEFIFVDDGSDDDSWALIRDLAGRDACVRGLRLDRRRGKSAALERGIAAAAGEWIATLDADLQDDPAEIGTLLNAATAGAGGSGRAGETLAAVSAGHDSIRATGLVVGWRRSRRDSSAKRIFSAVFNSAVSALAGVRLHDHNCGLKLMKREVAAALWLDRGMHRFIPAMARAAGFRVAEVEVRHRPRRFGRSKYGWSRPFRAAYDLLRLIVRTRWFSRPAASRGDLSRAGSAHVCEVVGFAAPGEARP